MVLKCYNNNNIQFTPVRLYNVEAGRQAHDGRKMKNLQPPLRLFFYLLTVQKSIHHFLASSSYEEEAFDYTQYTIIITVN